MAFGDLTTLAEVRAWLQTGQSALPITEDALLTRLIAASSQYIQTWLGRQITPADYLEMRDGTGGRTLQFACFPAADVLSLAIDGQAIPRAASSSAAGYSFSPTQLSVRGYRFGRGIQNVVISYTAGYATVPPDMAQACIELVALRYRERARIGEISKSLGGAETVTYSQKDMSDSIKALLAQYRMVVPVAGIRPIVAPADADVAMPAAIP